MYSSFYKNQREGGLLREKKIYVYIDWEKIPLFVGCLFTRHHEGLESAHFEYDPHWLQNPLYSVLKPSLMLHSLPLHKQTGKALFGALGDSSPDIWGRNLMRRAQQIEAGSQIEEPEALQEVDFLLNVDDTCRHGALRFKDQPEGPFLNQFINGEQIPSLDALPSLLKASKRIIQGKDNVNDMNLLFKPAACLGGERPKTTVLSEEGNLLIAKFSNPNDEWNIPEWECHALTLASKAGFLVTPHKLVKVSGHSVLLLKRFDRFMGKRIPFLTFTSLLGASVDEGHSYAEVAVAIRQCSSQYFGALRDLWKRIVLAVLISNRHHLRNYGILLPDLSGWRLAPMYDINPKPIDIMPKHTPIFLNNKCEPISLELVLSVSEEYGFSLQEAKKIAKEIAKVTSNWRNEAKVLGIKESEIERMTSAFEHNHLRLALSF